MWKEYSLDYVKRNRASSISIAVASGIASLFLSLLSALFYNIWVYEIENIAAGEVSWKEKPTPLTFFVIAIFLLVALSLILIIKNSFAVSMNARIHQFGIFKSVGATLRQIRTCLLQEAGILCTLPILAGSAAGIALCYAIICGVNQIGADLPLQEAVSFRYHPMVFAGTLLTAAVTVFVSAWLPARKLSRMTCLAAIRSASVMQLKKAKPYPILSFLFGMEGELAGNAIRAQKKALRTSTISLTLSFLGFTLMLCFFTLSAISTKYTYFDRYQDAWDIMVRTKDMSVEEGWQQQAEALAKLTGDETLRKAGLRDAVLYQRQEAQALISGAEISRQVNELGGLGSVAKEKAVQEGDVWKVKANLVILDDAAFAEYGRQTGIDTAAQGAIVWNQIWDSTGSNFRYKEYVPYIEETQQSIALCSPQKRENTVLVPVLGVTQELLALREEYDNYALVLFMPESLWETVSRPLTGDSGQTQEACIRILAQEEITRLQLEEMEQQIGQILGCGETLVTENRLREKAVNDNMIRGYQIFLGGFCLLLAVIGIANVFSNALGLLRQRRRELAQYLSVGMTGRQMCKMFGVEVLLIAGRPLLITLPVTVVIVGFMIRASYLDPAEFIRQAPLLPILCFSLFLFASTPLAYYLGAKGVHYSSLTEALRDDTQ